MNVSDALFMEPWGGVAREVKRGASFELLAGMDEQLISFQVFNLRAGAGPGYATACNLPGNAGERERERKNKTHRRCVSTRRKLPEAGELRLPEALQV